MTFEPTIETMVTRHSMGGRKGGGNTFSGFNESWVNEQIRLLLLVTNEGSRDFIGCLRSAGICRQFGGIYRRSSGNKTSTSLDNAGR